MDFFVSDDVRQYIDGVSELTRLMAYWSEKSGDTAMPDIASISLDEMPDLINSMMYLDVCQDPRDYLYRHYGSDIAIIFGADMTGKTLSSMPARPIFKFITIYDRIVDTGLPHFSLHRVDTTLQSGKNDPCWERLMLPVSDDLGHVVRILCVNCLRDWNYRHELYAMESLDVASR